MQWKDDRQNLDNSHVCTQETICVIILSTPYCFLMIPVQNQLVPFFIEICEQLHTHDKMRKDVHKYMYACTCTCTKEPGGQTES